jgi:hypothetical protein
MNKFVFSKAPSATERERVKKAQNEPLQITFLQAQKKLSPSLIEEALTISELFTLSELSSVELLLEAEEQMQYFHGFNRGLTAILLYYDSKKLFINNLKTILLARTGRTWILDENMPQEISSFLNSYVDRLIQGGLVQKLLSMFDYGLINII